MKEIFNYCNGFVIIDFLSENDMQTGRTLEENIGDWILQSGRDLFCRRVKCKTMSQMIKALDYLYEIVLDEQEIPFLHLEGHAAQDGISIDGISMHWDAIFQRLRKINIACRNNLFFSSGACNSAYVYKSGVSIKEPCPVLALLAPETVVQAGEVRDGFNAFYKKLILENSIEKGLLAFSEATASKKFSVLYSQFLFEQTFYNWIKIHGSGQGRKQNQEDSLTMAKRLGINLPNNQARKIIKRELRSHASLFQNYHSRFMMTDKYLENKARFPFDAVEFEKRVKNRSISNEF